MDNNFNNAPNNGVNYTNDGMGMNNSSNMDNGVVNNQFQNAQPMSNQYQTSGQYQTNNQYQANQFGNAQTSNNTNGYGNIPPAGSTINNTNPPKKKGGAGCIIAVVLGVIALLVVVIIVIFLLMIVPALDKYVDKNRATSTSTEFYSEPTVTSDEDYTTDPSTSSIDLSNSTVIGNESVGYINVPSTFIEFKGDQQLGGDPNYVQYGDLADPKTVVTLQAYNANEGFTSYDVIMSMYDQLLETDGVDVSSVTTSTSTIGGYGADEVYAYFPDSDVSVKAWATSETDDGLIHYVAIEFSGSKFETWQLKDTFSIYN